MELDPHQLIEGTVIAAYAVGAAQAFLYVRGEMALAQERIAQALNDAYANNLVGRNILGTDFSVDVTLTWGAGAYIVGEETALIESLEGERGMPRLKPPYFPAAKGLYMQPTIVNNVETLSNMPWIINESGQSFHDLGAPTSTGMRMFAVSGHVNRRACSRCPTASRRSGCCSKHPSTAAGPSRASVKAFIPGGASAMWFFDEHLDLPLDKPTVDQAGSMLGSGAIVVMDDTTDMVAACWRIVRFFARESCGKCTPCREGTTWLERILKRMLDGHGRPTTWPPCSRSASRSARARLAAAADHHLPARPVRREPDRLGGRRFRTSSSTTSPTAAPIDGVHRHAIHGTERGGRRMSEDTRGEPTSVAAHRPVGRDAGRTGGERSRPTRPPTSPRARDHRRRRGRRRHPTNPNPNPRSP
jgi:NADH:ubiquinone oxidoreductase subunit F (NADH-binding)